MLSRTLLAFVKGDYLVIKNLIGIKSETEEIKSEKVFVSNNENKKLDI